MPFSTVMVCRPGIDLRQLAKNQIRVAFVLKLPFRLRVGEFYRTRCDVDGPTEICFRNALPIPAGTETHEVLRKIGRSYDTLWTDALIISEQPRVEDSELEALRNWDKGQPTNLTRNVFEAISALNQWLVAYSSATKQLLGGRPLRALTDEDFFALLSWGIVILCEPKCVFDNKDLLGFFDTKSERRLTSLGQLTGQLSDLPEMQLSGIGEQLRRQKAFIFYEFAFQAKSRMGARDFVGALLMSVVALEAAHAAFVSQSLTECMKAFRDEEEINGLVNDLLREQGLFTLYKITPFVFMKEDERPPVDLLEACADGIHIRNDIMHAATDRKGRYKLRRRKNVDISKAFSSVLKVYEYYVNALERRLAPKGI